MKNKRGREEPCQICQHYHDYDNGEPCSICGHRLLAGEAKSEKASAFPSEIVPGFLYLGSYDNASRSELLKTLGISHILNTVPACQILYKNSFTYHTVSSSPPDLLECFSFLENIRKEGKRVLVHCMTGASRSPAVVIGYLMKHKNQHLPDSFAWVHSRRPSTLLKAEDVAVLQAWEISLFSTDAQCDLSSTTSASVPGEPASQGQLSAALLQPTATLTLNAQTPYGLATSWHD